MSELLDVLIANNESICRALADSTADFICLATSHGEPFYLNPAGRRMVGLGDEESAPLGKPARLLLRGLVEGVARRGGAGGQSQRALGRPQPASQPQDRRAAGRADDHVSRQVAAKRQTHLPGHPASRRRPLGPAPRGAGRVASPQTRHPRIVAGPDPDDQPRGHHYRVQSGGRAGVRLSPATRCWGRGRPTCSSPLDQRRPAQPHRALPGGGRGVDAGQAGGSDGGPRQRRDLPRRNGHDHQPGAGRAGADRSSSATSACGRRRRRSRPATPPSWSDPTATWSSSPTWRRTTSRSRCGRSAPSAIAWS